MDIEFKDYIEALPKPIQKRGERLWKRDKRRIENFGEADATISCLECPAIWHVRLDDRGWIAKGDLRCKNINCISDIGKRKKIKPPKAWFPRNHRWFSP